mgnify:CR=1 FL=1
MTRRDYEMIARVVGRIKDSAERTRVACDFAVELQKDNPSFKMATFIRACEAESK